MKMTKLFIKFFVTGVFVISVFNSCDDTSGNKNGSSSPIDSLSQAAMAMPEKAVPNALPFTLTFVEQQYNPGNPPLPRLQSYVAAASQNGMFLVVGGRRQGLHTFQAAPANNFIKDSSNNFMYVIDPANGLFSQFNVNNLPPNLSAPLQSTNQQLYHDPQTDIVYIVGGYGWAADSSDMLTFPTIISFKLEAMVNAILSKQSPSTIQSLMQVSQDDRFAVTGGELFKLNGQFYLVFGQKFTGQYRAFGGTDFSQKYTEEVRVFTLKPNTLSILSYGATTNSDPDQPFHRRDGNIIEDIDPATGAPRIAAFGGVFQPGIIGAYTYPIYINGPSTPVLNRDANQKFSQYECPVITLYDSSSASPTVYHNFFGGIGHYYLTQTPSQHAAYDTVTAQGRNDGFPFVEDITTFSQTANGAYSEFISTSTTPNNRLVGSSVRFIGSRVLFTKGLAYANGVIKLPRVSTNNKLLLGYIFGGVEAQNPLPLEPNTGTFVSNSVFAVYLLRAPSAAIPASEGHESVKRDHNLKRR